MFSRETNRRNEPQKPVKVGLPPVELRRKAEALLDRNGLCLLVGDIIRSKEHHGFATRADLQVALLAAIDQFNHKWDSALPLNNLRNLQDEKGAVVITGDALVMGIDDAAWIDRIQKHLAKALPQTEWRWSAAVDGWDREGTAIAR